MNIRRFPQFIKLSLLLVFYVALFFYMITFPSSFSWIIFYFFSFLFVGSYVTTLFSWGRTSLSVHTHPNGRKQPTVTVQTRNRLPLLIPRLSFTLYVDSFAVSKETFVFLKRRISIPFPSANFPRGHYSSLELLTEGQDFFHLFPYVSKKILSAEFDVFPQLLPQSLREKALKKSAPMLASTSRFGAENDQFRQIRTHQEQDTMKDIDWKTSFRKRELMVKEYEKEAERPLTLCFFGSESSHFEKLVSLAYGLHSDLSKRQQVNLMLLGEFEEEIHLEQSSYEFVKIQPAEDKLALLNIWDQSFKRQERRIVIAPKKDVETLKKAAPNPLLILTEEDVKER